MNLQAEGFPATLQTLSFWKDFKKGFKKGFQETAKVAQKLSPMAEAYAEQKYGKDYADAIHQSTQITGQVADGLDYFQNLSEEQQVMNLQAEGFPATLQTLSFWKDFKKGFKKGFQETAKVAQKLSPMAEAYAKDKYGQEYADAIHTSTQTTGQIAQGLDYFQQL